MAFVFGMLNSYLRDREISQHLTNLARTLAIRDADAFTAVVDGLALATEE